MPLMDLFKPEKKKRLLDYVSTVKSDPAKKQTVPSKTMSYFESGKNKKKRYDRLAGIEE